MEKPKDYYRLLGVSRDATLDAIKRAYRRLARKYHPDRGAGSSTQDFQDLQAAYATLADVERRRRYDETLHGHEPQEHLAWSFVRSASFGDLRRPTRPGSLSGEILLTPEEAAAGGVMPLDVPILTSCPSCEGTGGFIFDCLRCQGEGKVERRFPVPLQLPPRVREGTVFQVTVDDPAVICVLLTVHIRAL